MSQRNYDNPDYKDARRKVLERDDYKCRLCGSKKHLECHHIRAYASNQSLAYEPNNMIVLCKKCHKRITGSELYYQELLTKLVRAKQK